MENIAGQQDVQGCNLKPTKNCILRVNSSYIEKFNYEHKIFSK